MLFYKKMSIFSHLDRGNFAKLPVRKFKLIGWIELKKTFPKYTPYALLQENVYFFSHLDRGNFAKLPVSKFELHTWIELKKAIPKFGVDRVQKDNSETHPICSSTRKCLFFSHLDRVNFAKLPVRKFELHAWIEP